jgi:hypothetical protein
MNVPQGGAKSREPAENAKPKHLGRLLAQAALSVATTI